MEKSSNVKIRVIMVTVCQPPALNVKPSVIYAKNEIQNGGRRPLLPVAIFNILPSAYFILLVSTTKYLNP